MTSDRPPLRHRLVVRRGRSAVVDRLHRDAGRAARRPQGRRLRWKAAAVQALQQQLQDKDARIGALEAQLAQMQGTVDTLRRAVDERLASLEEAAATAAIARR